MCIRDSLIKKGIEISNNIAILLPSQIKIEQIVDYFEEVIDNSSDTLFNCCWGFEVYYYNVNNQEAMTLVIFNGLNNEFQQAEYLSFLCGYITKQPNQKIAYNVENVVSVLVHKLGMKVLLHEVSIGLEQQKSKRKSKKESNKSILEYVQTRLVENDVITESEATELFTSSQND
eukprot:TRINITY_DN1281_c0_g3_i1.p2 TRINITY_DN1281_c0_g3~~TRINITY_DN1281_c0_g3_i1.p2  ORF type:complete len:174 (-),score=17.95 TRINITY_DN1281_c0_g3_i1:48-569(-)